MQEIFSTLYHNVGIDPATVTLNDLQAVPNSSSIIAIQSANLSEVSPLLTQVGQGLVFALRGNFTVRCGVFFQAPNRFGNG